jgi:hypothetical protein
LRYALISVGLTVTDGSRFTRVAHRLDSLLCPQGQIPPCVRTGIILNTTDIETAYQGMKQLGIDVDRDIARIGSPAKTRIRAVEQAEPQPPVFWFRDPDGNQLLLVELHPA